MSIVMVARGKSEIDREVASIRKAAREIGKSKKSATKFLQENGFITAKGKLTRQYGG